MKKRLLALFIVVVIFVGIIPMNIFAQASNEIIILYESDAHCEVSGYSKLAALKSELKTESNHVAVVSAGDYVQGGTIGAISRGEYIVRLMNLVGYDAVALGNHEFDYKIDRLLELSEIMNTKPICSNLKHIDGRTVFEPYKIVSYGDIDVAYVAITTPDTITSSSPAQFKDENGEYIYTFSGENLASVVQSSIDDAKAAGAEYVIGLSHLGSEYVEEKWSVQTLIKGTSGFDAVIDGHSHSVIKELKISDKSGKDVLVTSAGTKFANVGKITIANGQISSELISLESYQGKNAEVDNYIAQIAAEYKTLGDRKIGTSKVNLTTLDENGNRIIRKSPANIGDFCADAYRLVLGADIGVINGGGIRDNISIGEITFNDILSVFPFNNSVCVVKVKGQVIKDMLEFGTANYPEENGSLQHPSGLTYKVNVDIPHSIDTDENGNFVSVHGDYRVYDIKVLNQATGAYEELDLNKEYTVASHNYLLLDCGEGMSMFKNAQVIKNDGMIDVDLLEEYIVKNLNGEIGEEYLTAQNRIDFVSPPKYEYPEFPEYKVTFVIDGETVETQTVKQGGSAVAPKIPEKSGYNAAWDKDGKNISGDTVITAVYTPIGSGEVVDQLDFTIVNIISAIAGALIIGVVVCTICYSIKKKKAAKKDDAED